MNTAQEIIIKKAKFELSLMLPKDINFFETLRQKLLWGNDKRN
jgi:NAD+ kinase